MVFNVFQIYEEKFVAVCGKIFDFGMKEHERREKEVEEFGSCMKEAKDDNKIAAAKLIDGFEEYRKKLSILS